MSALHCGLRCASHVDCKSFDYDPALTACYLGSVAVGTNCTEHMLPQAGSAAQHFAQVYCDQMTLKARTVLMKRRGGGENFLREMEDYSGGFGELSQDHWLGLRYMHLLTSNRPYQLK
ncbi:hypothetical protein ACOMHN_010345 [Nucella lapillus]